MTPRAIRIDHAARDARMGDYPLAWFKPCVISFTISVQGINLYVRNREHSAVHARHTWRVNADFPPVRPTCSKRNSRALTRVEIAGLFIVRANYQSNLHSCHYTEASD